MRPSIPSYLMTSHGAMACLSCHPRSLATRPPSPIPSRNTQYLSPTLANTCSTDKVVLATNGFAADGINFVKRVKQRLERYENAHHKPMSIKSIARMIQTMLYARRFFPYYVYNILGGIEEDGTGAVYSFDPVGSYEREACRAAGAAQSLIQPFLDNQIYFRNMTFPPDQPKPIPGNLPLGTVMSIVIDSFTGATERHIEVGDGLEMFVVMKQGRSTEDLTTPGLLPDGLEIEEQGPIGAGGKERTFLVRMPLKRD